MEFHFCGGVGKTRRFVKVAFLITIGTLPRASSLKRAPHWVECIATGGQGLKFLPPYGAFAVSLTESAIYRDYLVQKGYRHEIIE